MERSDTMGQSKYNESNILLLSSFQYFTVFISYQNDNSSLLAEWFQHFTGMIIPVKCWNCSASKLLRFVTHLSWDSYSQHSVQMSNKTITAFYFQNDSSISLEWSFKWNAGIILQVNICYRFVTCLSWFSYSHSAQMSDKIIRAVYLQYFTGMIIQVKCWNRSVYELSKQHNSSVSW